MFSCCNNVCAVLGVRLLTARGLVGAARSLRSARPRPPSQTSHTHTQVRHTRHARNLQMTAWRNARTRGQRMGARVTASCCAGCSCSSAAQSHSALIRMPINATRALSRTLSMHRWQLTRERNAAQQRGTAVTQSGAAHTNSAGAPTGRPGSRRGVARCAVRDCRVESAHQACSVRCSSMAACWYVLHAQVVVLPGLRPAVALRAPHRRSPHTQRRTAKGTHVRISYASAHEHSKFTQSRHARTHAMAHTQDIRTRAPMHFRLTNLHAGSLYESVGAASSCGAHRLSCAHPCASPLYPPLSFLFGTHLWVCSRPSACCTLGSHKLADHTTTATVQRHHKHASMRAL